jgi:hypothetical protein
MTAKTCAIPGGPPGLFPTPKTGQLAGGFRQVTLTYFIAVPLAVTTTSKTAYNRYD